VIHQMQLCNVVGIE